jgi:hypothetical protein
MDGKFGVDYIFRDMKTAIQTLKIYNDQNAQNPEKRRCWPVIYAAKLPMTENDDYYVYLDTSKKRLHISASAVDDSPFNGRRIALPLITNTVPSIDEIKNMLGF